MTCGRSVVFSTNKICHHNITEIVESDVKHHNPNPLIQYHTSLLQTEAPILIRPFLALMTRSELHAVMTGGFATIAGGVLAAYISFGVRLSIKY